MGTGASAFLFSFMFFVFQIFNANAQGHVYKQNANKPNNATVTFFFFFFDLRYTIYKELLFDDRSRSLSTAETNNKQQPKMNEGFQNIIHKRKRKKMNISLLDSSI